MILKCVVLAVWLETQLHAELRGYHQIQAADQVWQTLIHSANVDNIRLNYQRLNGQSIFLQIIDLFSSIVIETLPPSDSI